MIKWKIVTLVLIVISIPLAIIGYSPYQVHMVDIKSNQPTIFNPQLTIYLTLRNDAPIEVRADASLEMQFIMSNGKQINKTYYFDTSTIVAGGVKTLSVDVPFKIVWGGEESIKGMSGDIVVKVSGPFTSNIFVIKDIGRYLG